MLDKLIVMKSPKKTSHSSAHRIVTLIDVKEVIDLAAGEQYVISDFIELNRNGFYEFKANYRSEMYAGNLENLRRVIHKIKAIANFLKFQVLLDLMEIGKQLIVSDCHNQSVIEAHLSDIETSCDIAIEELETLLA